MTKLKIKSIWLQNKLHDDDRDAIRLDLENDYHFRVPIDPLRESAISEALFELADAVRDYELSLKGR